MTNLFKSASCLLAIAMLGACSSQDDVINDLQGIADENQMHTCPLNMTLSLSGFDASSRADESDNEAVWTNGDKIYLTFSVGTSTTFGDAVYDGEDWVVNYYGTLTQGVTATCTAVYFENISSASGSVVNINEKSAIYEDTNGQYLYSDGVLSIVANLKPKTGRIRFTNEQNATITVYGLTHYSMYDYSTGKFYESKSFITMPIDDGTSPYYYGSISGNDNKLMLITAESGYTKSLSSDVMRAGESGYLSIPTEKSSNGWLNSLVFNINGETINMIPVYNPSTYRLYFLAETETTEGFYNAVMNGAHETSDLPKTGLSNDEWNTFITKLNGITELNFRLPANTEWTYAAQGGSKSQKFTYSGSNVLSNVGWYYDNSNDEKHPVKQKQPNELGFYDMSGNVAEIAYYSSYTTYYYGGYYLSAESNCTNTYYTTSLNNMYKGLRLALSF